jgi:hypothetical protein
MGSWFSGSTGGLLWVESRDIIAYAPGFFNAGEGNGFRGTKNEKPLDKIRGLGIII